MIPDVSGRSVAIGEERKEKKVVHAMPYVIDSADTTPFWVRNEATDSTDVVRAYTVAHTDGPAEEPHYVSPDYGNGRRVMAERIAEAVKAAILSGDLDPADILP